MSSKRHALLAATLVVVLAWAAPLAVAQEYTTPTTPEYQVPDSDAGPDDDSAAPGDDEDAPAGAGAPVDEPGPGAAGTLPRTGPGELAFLTVLGLVLLLAGFTVRRGVRPLG